MISDFPRQRLCELITRYGASLCDDPRCCEGLLRDYCPGHKREIYVLVAAIKERTAAELLDSADHFPLEALIARLSKRLEDNLDLNQEFSRWAVWSWALALGKVPPPRQLIGESSEPVSARAPKETEGSASSANSTASLESVSMAKREASRLGSPPRQPSAPEPTPVRNFRALIVVLALLGIAGSIGHWKLREAS